MKKILLWLLTLSALLLSSCGNQNSVDIINPDAEFQYFFWATCPHCQELNEAVKSEDLFSKITVEKREVYFNTENRDMFLALTKKLGLSEKETGVPFVYDTVSGKHAVGVGPALKLFKSRLGTGSEIESATGGEIQNNTPLENNTNSGVVQNETSQNNLSGALDVQTPASN